MSLINRSEILEMQFDMRRLDKYAKLKIEVSRL